MRGNQPRKPSGSSAEATFARAVWEELWGSGRLTESPNALINQTTRGKSIIVKPQVQAAAATSGIRYRGTYSSTTTYNTGDIVRVQSGNSQGVWISVSTAALTNDPPVFPEPLSTGGTNKWEIFALGIQSTQICQNGSKTVYVNATPPIP